MSYPTVDINGTDLFMKYKAVLVERHSIQPPEPKTFLQEIPGADGAADLSTSVSGRVTYSRREITMNFQSEHAGNKWASVLSEILGEFHGKEGKLTFGDDPSYYYFGRMKVSDYERSRTFGKFTISTNAEPYKYERQSSLEQWLWGPFSLRTGVIRDYRNIKVDGKRVLVIPGTERWAIPSFIVEGSISVTFEGVTHTLKPGKSKIYKIAIKQGQNMLEFSGRGTVSVDYRGGML